MDALAEYGPGWQKRRPKSRFFAFLVSDQNGVKKVDFLSMDIEGSEPPALAGFGIDRFEPALACIEIKPDTREKVHAYFAAHGYEWLERYLRCAEDLRSRAAVGTGRTFAALPLARPAGWTPG